jgi:hypothetical protein
MKMNISVASYREPRQHVRRQMVDEDQPQRQTAEQIEPQLALADRRRDRDCLTQRYRVLGSGKRHSRDPKHSEGFYRNRPEGDRTVRERRSKVQGAPAPSAALSSTVGCRLY